MPVAGVSGRKVAFPFGEFFGCVMPAAGVSGRKVAFSLGGIFAKGSWVDGGVVLF